MSIETANIARLLSTLAVSSAYAKIVPQRVDEWAQIHKLPHAPPPITPRIGSSSCLSRCFASQSSGVVYSGSIDKSIKLWAAGACVQTLEGHAAAVRRDARFSPRRTLPAAACTRATLPACSLQFPCHAT
eukprot:3977671-Pleurochrysis_carterae.AAC.3